MADPDRNKGTQEVTPVPHVNLIPSKYGFTVDFPLGFFCHADLATLVITHTIRNTYINFSYT